MFIKNTHALQQLFTFNFAFNQNGYLAKWLPLISDLVYNIVQRIHISTLFNASKHFIFASGFVNLSDIIHTKYFIQEKWVGLSSDVHENSH